jgi:hypothetical protein
MIAAACGTLSLNRLMVYDEHVRPERRSPFKRFNAVAGRFDLIPFTAEYRRQNRADLFFVIDDENFRARGSCHGTM